MLYEIVRGPQLLNSILRGLCIINYMHATIIATTTTITTTFFIYYYYKDPLTSQHSSDLLTKPKIH